MDSSDGDFCYFHRDLSRGNYGSDVACLQQFLKHEGFLSDQPSGYFGPTTEAAVTRWQLLNNLSPASGAIEFTSRAFYAKRNRLPTAEELLALEVQAQGSVRTCLDVVCTEQDGGEFCQTGCLKRGSPDLDKYHLCQQVCQVAAGKACDRAFPPTQSVKYKKCISVVAKNCKQACHRGLKSGSSGSY
eukprot:c15393_g1_i2 orf=99-659(-)